MDVSARVQFFDLKSQYCFQCVPGVDQYNMPLYTVQTQPGGQVIGPYPVYQGFETPVYVNGIQVPFYTQKSEFWNLWPNSVQALAPAAIGDGINSNYTINLPFSPALPGHVDMAGIIANSYSSGNVQDPPITPVFLTDIPTTSVYAGVYFTTTDGNGNQVIVSDSGQFLQSNVGYGLLMAPGPAPLGNVGLSGGYSVTLNTVNYATGVANVTFTASDGAPIVIPANTPINAQCYFYEQGIPRALLFYNNVITMRPPPNIPYRVELAGYLTPAAFLNSGAAISFGYMAEYIARGAARKILADTGDMEQFMFYEPLFKEQETLVWKRSQRQFTSTRTGTIFSETQGQTNYNNIGAGTN